ncbi:N-acetylglucosamine-6-phosphate deacetylase [Pullulanibacillus camelliae]|uniref:N-acetylglucosamine-6-phosphate deacetylase n=1 Tax=Pullulanibacillus camelliae TaxID=1707096 RepID=A0A8J3E0X5_9BACL|nr:N-acetylglucosamine-6-phosphate deacetylase [Pullulanibacillus camelliae]GGE52353.1 N-acetylglucosamine-6-phosphate deacetylase [Pullulanibacillus camelliae]
MLLSGLTVYLEDRVIQNGYVLLKNGKIEEVGEGLPENGEGFEHQSFSPGYKLIPGMIDVHIHGANQSDVMDATYEALANMATVLPKEGTTSFLATTITQEPRAIEKALTNVDTYLQHPVAEGAEVLGVHLEGPYINKEKAGAQPPNYIIPSDIEQFDHWNTLSGERIKLVTLAPEVENGLAFIRHLVNKGIVASIGHSAATYKEVTQAVEAGATHVTHLFNGMSGLHHREPGVVGSAFLHDALFTEMIVDGIHIVPESVKLAYQIKGQDRIILITDAMRAKCMKNGIYDLGGQQVTVENGKATLPEGQLAGSVLKMADALRNMMAFADTDLPAVIKMGSENPAKQLNVFDRKGSIAAGKDADLLILNEDNEIVMTLCRGAMIKH